MPATPERVVSSLSITWHSNDTEGTLIGQVDPSSETARQPYAVDVSSLTKADLVTWGWIVNTGGNTTIDATIEVISMNALARPALGY
jgi:hypothetical protein